MGDSLTQDILSALQGLAEEKSDLLTDPADCWPYGYDNSRRHAPPAAVFFARGHEQLVNLVRLCHDHGRPLTARGMGTGTTGATVPLNEAIVVSFERMARILEVDPDNRYARVEPGVTNQALQDSAAEHGLFWPPDPTSASVSTIGGNLAYNSAGPRAVKYGTPRENTLGLTAVTGTGATLRTGTLTTKGVVGYDLTRLIIGSEGTLALITEAVLKLTPLAESKRTLRARYRDIHSAAGAVSAIMGQPVTPCALEFMDKTALQMVRSHEDLGFGEETGALLMIEVDGPAHCIDEAARSVANAASTEGALEIEVARDEKEVARLWRVRKALSPALRNVAPKKINEDVAVPVSRLPELIGGLENLAAIHQITIVNFGHAGNGNIHVNLLVNPDDPAEMQRAEACLQAVFSLVLELGGTLSGEHGVGLEKRDYIADEISPETLDLMRRIKRQFDPKGILNPLKALPPEQP